MKNYLAAVVAVLVWYLIWDNFLGTIVAGFTGSAWGQIPGILAEYSKLWETVGDLFAALIVVGMYARTRSVFGVGAKNGAIYGVYAGLLIHFPTWLFMTVYAAWPYAATWTVTLTLVGMTVVAGAIMGTVYQVMGGAKTA